MATLLASRATTITPLNHHFAVLAALTLVELADFPDTREGAWRGIDALHEALDKGHGFSGREDSTGWDSAIRDLVLKKKQQLQAGGSGPLVGDSRGLQHLADLAVGVSDGENRDREGGTQDQERPEGTTATLTATTTTGGAEETQTQQRQVEEWDPMRVTREGYLTVLVGGVGV
jgi:hypothetical protein